MPPAATITTQETVTLPEKASTPHWKSQLAGAIRSGRELLQRLSLDGHLERITPDPDFSCLVTEHYLAKIQPGDIDDPLLRQVLPLADETLARIQQAGQVDPVGDLDALTAPGLLHKYHARALMITTGACAIHCRYCFRRLYPYASQNASEKHLHDIIEYLERHPEIDEIILSGGDPLVLDNQRLQRLLDPLQALGQLQTLRIHTRLPVVLPARIDDGLLQRLQASRLQTVMVIHANHANELQQDEQQALLRLHAAGVTLLNQSVLLRDVNDNADTLCALSKRLLQCRTLPYYLHLLDPVKGAMHFNIPEKDAMIIYRQMQRKLPGYLLPRLVREIPGKPSKTAIFRI